MFSLGLSCLSISKGLIISHTWFAFYYFVATELCHRPCVPRHEFRFSIKCSRSFGGATQITLTISTMGISQDSISGTAIMMPNYSNLPKTLLCKRRFWRNFSILAIQSSHSPAPAVWQLNLPHLQHHQSLLMLKILVRPVKARQKKWHTG